MTITNFQSAVLVARQITPTPAFVATSATSLLIGTGLKTLTTQSGTAFRAGQYVRLISAADAANYMEGNINSYSGTTMVVNVLAIGPTASGTYADWVIGIAGSPGTGDLLSSANLSDVANVATARFNLGVREPLVATRNYYVRTDGNDAAGHTGLANTSGDAFLTIQRAVDVAFSNVDPKGQSVTINVADGTYTAGAIISQAKSGIPMEISIVGNTATPANVLINATSDCFGVSVARFLPSGMKLVSSGGVGISASDFAFVLFSSMDFGACAGAHIQIDSFAHVLVGGNYSITGVSGLAHIHMPGPGYFHGLAFTCTIVGTLTGASYFVGVRSGGGYAFLAPMTFVNGAGWNAARYVAHYGGVVDCEGHDKDFLPGTSPGGASDGGIYVGTTPVVGLGNRHNQVAINASFTLDIRSGLVWFDDVLAGGSALISFAGLTGAPVPTIVWQTGTSFVTGADPGAGSNKWWVQSGAIVTNRFGALNTLDHAIVTPQG